MKELSFSYFPGCSQTGSAAEFGLSAAAVGAALGVGLHELPDWNCCGASSAHMTDDLLSVALPARNLALARSAGRDLVAVCAACYSRLRSARARLNADAGLAARLEEVLGSSPVFEGEIRHLLDVLINQVTLPGIRPWLRQGLEGLKAVPYYGCLLVRPPRDCCCDSVENPTDLDRLLGFLGVEVCRWPRKTDCCGGSLSLSRPDLVEKLVNDLFESAVEAGAGCIVTACPMCAANLEMRQKQGRLGFSLVHRIPVLYFTEILGIALGLSGTRHWLESHIINPVPLLEATGVSLDPEPRRAGAARKVPARPGRDPGGVATG